MDAILTRIKRAALRGRLRFTEKALTYNLYRYESPENLPHLFRQPNQEGSANLLANREWPSRAHRQRRMLQMPRLWRANLRSRRRRQSIGRPVCPPSGRCLSLPAHALKDVPARRDCLFDVRCSMFTPTPKPHPYAARHPRSLSSASCSICRTRSRVRPICSPICLSVIGSWPSSP